MRLGLVISHHLRQREPGVGSSKVRGLKLGQASVSDYESQRVSFVIRDVSLPSHSIITCQQTNPAYHGTTAAPRSARVRVGWYALKGEAGCCGTLGVERAAAAWSYFRGSAMTARPFPNTSLLSTPTSTMASRVLRAGSKKFTDAARSGAIGGIVDKS
jgi:hypothetical protein